MSSDPDEFDPRRALDDWCVPQEHGLPELDLSEVLGRARRVALDPESTARLQRRGFRMQDIEDLEARLVRLAPQPEALPEAPSHQPSPRLLEQWQPDCWCAAARRILVARHEPPLDSGAAHVESYDPHWLLAVWPAQAGAPQYVPRWPEHVVLVAAQNSLLATEQLLARLPEDALLWLGQFDLDWALAAEVLVQHDPALSSLLAQALRDFSAIERLALSKRIRKAYEPAQEGRLLRRKKSEF